MLHCCLQTTHCSCSALHPIHPSSATATYYSRAPSGIFLVSLSELLLLGEVLSLGWLLSNHLLPIDGCPWVPQISTSRDDGSTGNFRSSDVHGKGYSREDIFQLPHKLYLNNHPVCGSQSCPFLCAFSTEFEKCSLKPRSVLIYSPGRDYADVVHSPCVLILFLVLLWF